MVILIQMRHICCLNDTAVFIYQFLINQQNMKQQQYRIDGMTVPGTCSYDNNDRLTAFDPGQPG